ncbi:fimbrial protein [Citrobacter braakii]|uniref:fimbrial protein n=1 Tax=Citrobacter braakii TaxID=57706 RepID=UPI000CDDCFA6|nr:type 1 fimbrial protein [Citrobacter braakii]EGT0643368.1 type 1 fimbrial protein [Citrobacter braakii]POT33599.1 hypothetical protein C3423_05730 [Citrobacter braakii]POT38428.1 hypothetical protein C3431_05730 [Citrobacter braakii]POT42499.1 hypothetical protein C3425_05730 [Citrobacter braakii]POT64570.1 hypothetical protein C3428_05615 [Citrobacter braakii]
MKKIISAVLFCAPLSALAADATVDLTFKGTLTQPTCSAAFTGMAGGTDIAFGNINASDIVGKADNTVITAAPVKDVSIQLTGCGGGITRVSLDFVGTALSGYGFNGAAASFVDPLNANALSGLGFAIFKDQTTTSNLEAISMKAGELEYFELANLTKTGETYKLPLYAKMVVTKNALLNTSAAVNTNSAGKDLSASAYVNIAYE